MKFGGKRPRQASVQREPKLALDICTTSSSLHVIIWAKPTKVVTTVVGIKTVIQKAHPDGSSSSEQETWPEIQRTCPGGLWLPSVPQNESPGLQQRRREPSDADSVPAQLSSCAATQKMRGCSQLHCAALSPVVVVDELSSQNLPKSWLLSPLHLTPHLRKMSLAPGWAQSWLASLRRLSHITKGQP